VKEQQLARELRLLHPLFFQRFDNQQLDRFLRAWPFLRLSQGRFVFGSHALDAEWSTAKGERAFLLLYGRVALFPDPSAEGRKSEIGPGSIFGIRDFRLGEETMQSYTAGAARCEEPSVVGVLSTELFDVAFADRAIGNCRIAQVTRQAPTVRRILDPEADDKQRGKNTQDKEVDEDKTAIKCALRDLTRGAAALHMLPGEEVLSDGSLDDSVLIVSTGSLEVRGDVRLVERLERLPRKKIRLRLVIEKAERLAGDSWFDKLDPYCIVKLGDFKKFQTPVSENAGPNPTWNYSSSLMFNGEEELQFTVMDHDQFTADDFCGSYFLPVTEIGDDGWRGKLTLTRPKRGIFTSGDAEEPAGFLFVSASWDFEKPVTAATRTPKSKVFPDQMFFTVGTQECWGHEQVVLGSLFRRTLEQAASKLNASIEIGHFRVICAQTRGGAANDTTTCWKVSGRRFLDFIKQSSREKPCMNECRLSSVKKQSIIKELASRLIDQWEKQEEVDYIWSGAVDKPKLEDKPMDPSHFRVAYRGIKATIIVRNAFNLPSGGWMDKLDPYAIVRFRANKAEFRTSVLQDAGSNPVWESEGSLIYNGETTLEISVWDYDKLSADDLVATGCLQVDQFSGGFEGVVTLNTPGQKASQRRSNKTMMLTLGVQWDPLPDVGVTSSTTGGNLAALRAFATGRIR